MTEAQTLVRQIRATIDRTIERLEGLDEAQLNRVPALDGANSPYVIAVHVLGNARAWVLGIAAGQPLHRDRPAEFASSGKPIDLRHLWTELAPELERAVEGLKPGALERRLVPSNELWGEGVPHEVSVREALLHVVEHASIHLGQLQVTLDLMKGEAGR